MNTGEHLVDRGLRALHLDALKHRILVFAGLATLIPALGTTYASYRNSVHALGDQLARDLRATSSEAARELGLWLGLRLRELRTSAGSYVLTENLARAQGGRQATRERERLRAYLNTIRERFRDHEVLFVLDAGGRVVANTTGRTGGLRLGTDPLTALRTGDALVGAASWDATLGKAVLVLAVPIREADGFYLGALAAKLNFQSVTDLLHRLAPQPPGDVYVITDSGHFVIRARASSADLMQAQLSDTAFRALFDGAGGTVVHRGPDGQERVAALQRVPPLRWAVVAELPQAEARRGVGRLRAIAALMTALILAGVGVMIYILSLRIVRPLARLSAAANKIAGGDLTVELPVAGSGEAVHLAQAFNTVVARLRERENQAQLERLSITDALTGLYNRRHLMGTLASEVERSRRLRRPFSILLADIDHFKQYNDTHGHLAGDAALVTIADVLRKATRGVDCVARYGGEEFLVVLLETTIATAGVVAERIRARVTGEAFAGGRLTLSIGAAECPAHGDTPETLIASADAAMYRAKTGGRDRVVVAHEPVEHPPVPKRRLRG